jgi:hypothetical protein
MLAILDVGLTSTHSLPAGARRARTRAPGQRASRGTTRRLEGPWGEPPPPSPPSY